MYIHIYIYIYIYIFIYLFIYLFFYHADAVEKQGVFFDSSMMRMKQQKIYKSFRILQIL